MALTLFVSELMGSFLLAVGFLFIFLELRSRYDKSFLYFGLALVSLCLMVGVDLWVVPITVDLNRILLWNRVQHIMGCLFLTSLIRYLADITNNKNQLMLKGVLYGSLAMASLFLLPGLLFLIDEKVGSGMLYNLTFVPYFLLLVGISIGLIASGLKRSSGVNKKILKIHLLGIVALLLAGSVDLISIVFPETGITFSATLYGVFGFGLMATYIFTEKFLLLLKERQENFNKLQKTYKQLEEVNGLKQLGESAAIVNHQIKNYMHQVSYWSSVIERDEPISPRGMERLGNLNRMSTQILDFSQEILDMSRSHIIGRADQVDLTGMIMHVMDQNFDPYREAFIFEGLDRPHYVYGSWAKLEQVFINIFTNTIEASVDMPLIVKVKIIANSSVVMVKIEDFGIGCTRKQEEEIFRAFFTTKSERRGTGLGMTMVKNIIESHGGRISAYSKNSENSNRHGLRLIMTFPQFYNQKEGTIPGDIKGHIVLVKEELENFESMVKVLNNVKANPFVIRESQDVLNKTVLESLKVLLISPKAFLKIKSKLPPSIKVYLVANFEGKNYLIDEQNGNEPNVLSEEFVLSQIVPQCKLGVSKEQV